MSRNAPLASARLPSYSAVIDGLAAGLGILPNKEDFLADLGSFRRRIAVNCGSSRSPGVEAQLLELIAGSDVPLREIVKRWLGDAETALTDARTIPLVTYATEAEGLRPFIEFWAVPWLGQLLADAQAHPASMLNAARRLLELHAASATSSASSFLSTWKAEIRQALKSYTSAPEFHATLNRIDRRSQRKLSSAEQDLSKLRQELDCSQLPSEEIDSAVFSVRQLYIAGLATMRLCGFAKKVIPENQLISLICQEMRPAYLIKRKSLEERREENRLYYWLKLDPDLALCTEFDQIFCSASRGETAGSENAGEGLGTTSRSEFLKPATDFMEGLSHLFYGRTIFAKRCLQAVVADAGRRQLGEIAAAAASILIALRLGQPDLSKFEQLNPLLRVRLDNMPQWDELVPDFISTPFSDWSPRPTPSIYDSHLMMCVAFFNSLPCAPNVTAAINPLRRFDDTVSDIIAESRKIGSKMRKSAQKRAAVTGTSIKPYEALKHHLYYRDALGGLELPDSLALPGMDAYALLSRQDQQSVLRYIDPVQFQADLEAGY